MSQDFLGKYVECNGILVNCVIFYNRNFCWRSRHIISFCWHHRSLCRIPGNLLFTLSVPLGVIPFFLAIVSICILRFTFTATLVWPLHLQISDVQVDSSVSPDGKNFPTLQPFGTKIYLGGGDFRTVTKLTQNENRLAQIA